MKNILCSLIVFFVCFSNHVYATPLTKNIKHHYKHCKGKHCNDDDFENVFYSIGGCTTNNHDEEHEWNPQLHYTHKHHHTSNSTIPDITDVSLLSITPFDEIVTIHNPEPSPFLLLLFGILLSVWYKRRIDFKKYNL